MRFTPKKFRMKPDVAEGMNEQTYKMKTPWVAPFGAPVTRRDVQNVWDVFVKPTQSDDAPPQSVEDRTLAAILRSVYDALPEEES